MKGTDILKEIKDQVDYGIKYVRRYIEDIFGDVF